MRGGRVALLVAMLATPLALADAAQTIDPLRDERTTTSLKLLNGQPDPIECHDLSIDLASTSIARGASTITVTYRYYGVLAVPALECANHPLAPTDRTWSLHFSTEWLPFTGSATSAAGPPAAPCMRANWGANGNSGCVGSVTLLADGFTFELPRSGTLSFANNKELSYSLDGFLYARADGVSRATVVSPSMAVLYGAWDWGDTTLG